MGISAKGPRPEKPRNNIEYRYKQCKTRGYEEEYRVVCEATTIMGSEQLGYLQRWCKHILNFHTFKLLIQTSHQGSELHNAGGNKKDTHTHFKMFINVYT
jgi:hypothetical protein